MDHLAVLIAVAALVMLFVLAEIAAAALPLILVIALVPPEQRKDLAEVLAAYDSSHKLRLWPALRAAVRTRRRQRRDRDRNPRRARDTPFDQGRAREPIINAPRAYDRDVHRAGPGSNRPATTADRPTTGRSPGALPG